MKNFVDNAKSAFENEIYKILIGNINIPLNNTNIIGLKTQITDIAVFLFKQLEEALINNKE